MELNQITHEILDSTYKVHTALGPGLLESAYQACLVYELRKKGLKVDVKKPLPLIYEEVKLDCGYRIDILVENQVVVELKNGGSIDRRAYSPGFDLPEIIRQQSWFTSKFLHKKFERRY